MSARPREDDFEPLAAHSRGRDIAAPAKWIKRDEHLDFVFVRPFLEKVLHSAQIARAFFAHIRNEKNVTRRLNFG